MNDANIWEGLVKFPDSILMEREIIVQDDTENVYSKVISTEEMEDYIEK